MWRGFAERERVSQTAAGHAHDNMREYTGGCEKPQRSFETDVLFFLCHHSHVATQQSVTAIPYCLIPGELQMYYAFLSMYVYVCVSELNKVRNINVKVTYI